MLLFNSYRACSMRASMSRTSLSIPLVSLRPMLPSSSVTFRGTDTLSGKLLARPMPRTPLSAPLVSQRKSHAMHASKTGCMLSSACLRPRLGSASGRTMMHGRPVVAILEILRRCATSKRRWTPFLDGRASCVSAGLLPNLCLRSLSRHLFPPLRSWAQHIPPRRCVPSR